jgi:hypothetical protein
MLMRTGGWGLGMWKLDRYSEIKGPVWLGTAVLKNFKEPVQEATLKLLVLWKFSNTWNQQLLWNLKKNVELGVIIFKIWRTQNWKLHGGKNKSKNSPTLAKTSSSTLLWLMATS